MVTALPSSEGFAVGISPIVVVDLIADGHVSQDQKGKQLRVVNVQKGAQLRRRSAGSGRAKAQPNSMALYSDSLWSGWRASMSRTVPDFDRMTSDCVLAPNSS